MAVKRIWFEKPGTLSTGEGKAQLGMGISMAAAAPVIVLPPTFVENNIDYFRNYLLDLKILRRLPKLATITITGYTDAAITFFRKYLAKI